MSRTFLPTLAIVLTMLAFPITGFLPADGALKIHQHWQKSAYASSSEWPLISSQGHVRAVGQAVGTLAHTHVELWHPLYAEIPRSQLLTIRGRIQFFHVDGGLWSGNIFCPMARAITWDSTAPIVGNPGTVVVREFTLTIDPTIVGLSGVNGPMAAPENGWIQIVVTAYTALADGRLTETRLSVPVYVVGDPSVPEVKQPFGFDFMVQASASVQVASGVGFGNAISEYRDVYLPILAPLPSTVTVKGLSYPYARTPDWASPDLDRSQQVIDADLHNGIAGTLAQNIPSDPTGVSPGASVDMAFGPGAHKHALIWKQQLKDEELWSLLVVSSTSTGTPVEPPPPPPPVTTNPAITLYIGAQHLGWPGMEDVIGVTVYGDVSSVITRVSFTVNAGPETDGSFDGTGWSHYLTMTPGSYVVVARAYDATGKMVATQKTTVVR